MTPILPGETLGILGGGQLGRMFTIAARTMGYRVIVLDPDPHSPAGELADEHLRAHYEDEWALQSLGQACRAVTTEFENVPAESLAFLAQHCPVRPGAEAVAIVQDRIREKTFLRDHGFATARFEVVRQADEIGPALARIGGAAILKISRFGYDGKGQARVFSAAECAQAFAQMGGEPCVLEELLTLEREISVVVARGVDGRGLAYPVGENRHENGILDTTRVPAAVPDALARQATEAALEIARLLDYCGVMAVEFFVTAAGLSVNEIAPRPHNSGHYTLDACATDQFQQQVRAICGLPLGEVRLLSPVTMVNILGDAWGDTRPHWEALLCHPGVFLHLYGKREARRGRKMGHFNVLAPQAEDAYALALRLKGQLPA